ncbi:hypothetical protein ABBQ32_000658 [Trebouxia sp. C0010 RCD-2024]
MHTSLRPQTYSITSVQPLQLRGLSRQVVILGDRTRYLRPRHGRSLTVADEARSKSSKVTDTAPEGKGEQREQRANRTDGRTTWTKLRVERQTHLPASREEAWQALQTLLPEKEWKETSAVFASLEAIYRAELQHTGEELLSAFSIANSALEYIPPVDINGITVKAAAAKTKEVIPGMEAPPPVSQEPILQDASGESFDDPPTSFQDSSAESRRESHKHASSSGTKDTTPSSHSSSGTSSRRRATDHAAHSNLSGNDASNGEVSGDSGGQQHQAGNGNSNGNGVRGGEASLPNGAGAEQVKQAVSIVGNKMQQVVHEEGVDIASRSGIERLVQDGQCEAEELRKKAQQAVRHRLSTDNDATNELDTSSGGGKVKQTEPASVSKMLLTETAEPSDEAIIVPSSSSVDVTDVSRMGFDLRRNAMVGDRNKVDPEEADKRFVELLVKLLEKAHFAKFTGRDAAMSKSLNSDYLSQLYIRADTKSMDREFVKAEVATSGLPEEARALVVWKRGYGQARRRGRMISAKVDFLQLLVVKATVGRLAVGVGSIWTKIKQQQKRLLKAAPEGIENNIRSVVKMGNLRSQLKKTAGKLQEKAPQLTIAGGGLFMTLNNWGLVPESDVLPLEQFNRVWQPDEPERLDPVHVERVSIRDAVGGLSGLKRGGVSALWSKVELIEPTFQDLLVMYRQTQPSAGQLAKLRQRIIGPSEQESTPRYQQRNSINMRIYRDIPVPSWKIVFPNKLLQFRPLDGLRSDLATLPVAVLADQPIAETAVLAAAYLAQLKYDSVVLELITTGAVIAFIFRAFLGYKRLNERYERTANDMLAKSTIAGQEGVITYLANAAALQQFEQTGLAYVLMHEAGRSMGASGLAAAAESLLEGKFEVRVRFNAEEAIEELLLLDLISEAEEGDGAQHYMAVPPAQASEHLTSHWRNILTDRVEGRIQHIA